jgi:hypothetical protein
MSYSVQLGKEAKRKIAEGNLPKEGISAVLRGMDDLSERPSRILLRIESSLHILETDVVYSDPDPPPRDCLIALSVRYGVDEETLIIVDCYRICNDDT